MPSDVEAINELPPAKRRKKWVEQHPHFECPAPLSVWQGVIFNPETKFLSIAFEGIRKVVAATFENTSEDRKKHALASKVASKIAHRKRWDLYISREIAELQKSISNTVEIIPKS